MPVVAPSYDNGESNEGRAFLFFGNEGAGFSLRPRQRQPNNTGPIAHLGSSDSLDRFRLVLLALGGGQKSGHPRVNRLIPLVYS